MLEAVACQRCRLPIPADAPSGECPACLLLVGLQETPAGSREGTDAASDEQATVARTGFGSTDPDATVDHSPSPISPEKDWPTIPGYRIVGELGEGGFATVYKAEQLSAYRRLVAIKVMHGTSKMDRERIQRESRALLKISHPNIVTIFDVGETSEGPYFTMEYMPGGTLAERIKNHRPMPMESARIVEGVARGVAAAHKEKIRHRDLKPSNVLMSDDATPKVSDFGLAKFEESSTDMTTLERMTPTGALLGTPAYMAPEQAAGKTNEIDERTDVYGLGAVLYHCLTGKPPFRGENNAEIITRVLREHVVPPRSVIKGIPKSGEAICLKSLNKDKSQRYASSAEFADDIGRWLRNELTLARPLSAVGRGRLWAVRNSKVLSQLAVALLLLSAISAVLSLALWRKDSPSGSLANLETPWERMNRELMAGKTTIIPNEGLTDGAKWAYGAATLAPSPMNDGACSFQTIGTSIVDVLSPEVDHYRVDVELRLIQGKPQDGDVKSQAKSRDFVALMLGHQEAVAVDGTRVHFMVIAGFSESLSDEMRRIDKGKGRVQIDAFMFVHNKDAIIAGKARGFASRMFFEPRSPQPGDWRGLVADVSPSGIQLRWRANEHVKFETLANLTSGEITDRFRDLAASLSVETKARFGELAFKWTPRSAIGVYAQRAWVSIRNLEVEQLNVQN